MTPIQRAVVIVGSQREMAKALKVTDGLISQWVTDRRAVSATKVLAICELTGGRVKPEELRPDVFLPPKNSKKKRSKKNG